MTHRLLYDVHTETVLRVFFDGSSIRPKTNISWFDLCFHTQISFPLRDLIVTFVYYSLLITVFACFVDRYLRNLHQFIRQFFNFLLIKVSLNDLFIRNNFLALDNFIYFLVVEQETIIGFGLCWVFESLKTSGHGSGCEF